MSSKMYTLFKPSYQTSCISLLSNAFHMHCLPHPMSHPAGMSLMQKETTEYKDVTVNDKKAHGEWRYSSIHSYPQHQKVNGQSHTLNTLPLKKEHPSSARTHSIATLNWRQCYPRSFRKNLELNYDSFVWHSWDCASLMYSFKYNKQDAMLYNILYYCRCSTCFGRFFRPSSGAQNCTHSIGYMPSLLAATASYIL